jgi:hypothetical protein
MFENFFTHSRHEKFMLKFSEIEIAISSIIMKELGHYLSPIKRYDFYNFKINQFLNSTY